MKKFPWQISEGIGCIFKAIALAILLIIIYLGESGKLNEVIEKLF